MGFLELFGAFNLYAILNLFGMWHLLSNPNQSFLTFRALEVLKFRIMEILPILKMKYDQYIIVDSNSGSDRSPFNEK